MEVEYIRKTDIWNRPTRFPVSRRTMHSCISSDLFHSRRNTAEEKRTLRNGDSSVI